MTTGNGYKGQQTRLFDAPRSATEVLGELDRCIEAFSDLRYELERSKGLVPAARPFLRDLAAIESQIFLRLYDVRHPPRITQPRTPNRGRPVVL